MNIDTGQTKKKIQEVMTVDFRKENTKVLCTNTLLWM